MSNANIKSEWAPSSDIYDIVQMVDSTKKRFIGDQDETTLAIGLFGLVGDIESKKIQTAILNTGELGNEMFPTRARLTRNLITHAAYHNIQHINAVPASLTINIAVKVDDLDKYMSDSESGDQVFYFDHECPIMINNCEFHMDYDVRLSRAFHNRYDTDGSKIYTYTARYVIDSTDPNPLSDITNAYLVQPIIVSFNNYKYLLLQVKVKQYNITTTNGSYITENIINNKTYQFTFENQLADFVVYITENGITRRFTPHIYGSMIDPSEEYYCWYLYTSEDSVRLQFDQENYVPGYNADIKIVVYSTLGAQGNFKYTPTEDESGFYIDFQSKRYDYKKITCIVNCATESDGGTDRKSKDELRSLLPRVALSRGYLTTETDLRNYFDLISDEKGKLTIQRKVDNQLHRIWYSYNLIKDRLNNVIPTNSICINVNPEASYGLKFSDSRYIIPIGTTFVLDTKTGIGEFIDPSTIPDVRTDEYFKDKYYYALIENLVINTDPLYCSYYNSLISTSDYVTFDYANDYIDIGFIINKVYIERNITTTTNTINKNEYPSPLVKDPDQNTYRIKFTITQSSNEEYDLVKTQTNDETGDMIIDTKNLNMKVFVVFYKNNEIYRYTEAQIYSWNASEYTSTWIADLSTNNMYTSDDEIIIQSLGVPKSTGKNNGEFDEVMKAKIYVLARFTMDDDPINGYGKNLITDIVPVSLIDRAEDKGKNLFTLANVYSTHYGFTFFENYTDVINTKIRPVYKQDSTFDHFMINYVPMVGYHYIYEPNAGATNSIYLSNALAEKKAYVDYCVNVVENNMQVDFKLYNTYGPSVTYAAGSTTKIEDAIDLDHVDTTWKFRMKLINNNDITTKGAIVQYIKDYIEDMNNTGKDLHVSNLLHDIKDNFKDLIIYIEFKNFNDNAWGVNHLLLKNIEDPATVPEFINVRNRYKSDGKTVEPCIDIELDMT